jgi:hypothetical protein
MARQRRRVPVDNTELSMIVFFVFDLSLTFAPSPLPTHKGEENLSELTVIENATLPLSYNFLELLDI